MIGLLYAMAVSAPAVPQVSADLALRCGTAGFIWREYYRDKHGPGDASTLLDWNYLFVQGSSLYAKAAHVSYEAGEAAVIANARAVFAQAEKDAPPTAGKPNALRAWLDQNVEGCEAVVTHHVKYGD